MASGVINYISGVMAPHRDINAGNNAQLWPMKGMGSMSQIMAATRGKYRITKATITFDVRTSYGAGKHMIVRSQTGEQLGDVPCSATGSQTHALLTNPNYLHLQAIRLDGVNGTACQLRGGSYIRIAVYWETATAEVAQTPVQTVSSEPVIVSGEESMDGTKGKAMRAEVGVSFDGVDISKQINEYLLSASYTDNEEDEADDLQIKLEDRTNIWLQHWLDDTLQEASYGIKEGSKGLTINAGVKQYMPSGKLRKCDFGFFELDQIKASGPPSNILIKGTSLPYKNGIRTEERDKSWEGYTLKRIGQEIASKGGLGFIFDSPDDPSYSRVEQAQQTDIAFLQQLCHDAGKSLKISGMKLIIFDQARYESLEAVTTIKWQDGTYTKYDLSTQSGETHYDQCTVTYFDASSGNTYSATANAEDYDSEASQYTVCTVSNRKVGSNAEAMELAKKILRLHNKYEKRVTFTMIGDPLLCAGLTVTLNGFGLWDEKYIIKQCRHEISNSGYLTKLTLRSIPEGNVKVIKVEREEETTEETATATNTGTKKSTGNKQQTQKSWYANEYLTVYGGKEGGSGQNLITKDSKVQVLGSMSGDRTLVQCGNVTGYVNTASLQKREDKTKSNTKK